MKPRHPIPGGKVASIIARAEHLHPRTKKAEKDFSSIDWILTADFGAVFTCCSKGSTPNTQNKMAGSDCDSVLSHLGETHHLIVGSPSHTRRALAERIPAWVSSNRAAL